MAIRTQVFTAVTLCCLRALFIPAAAQQVGSVTEEDAPAVTIQHCTKAAGCKDEETTVTLDANWRWVHNEDSKNCYTDGEWDEDECPDAETCAKNCALDGVDAESYEATYGVKKVPGGVKLRYVTKGTYGVNVGSRLYMLDGEDTYKMFKLKNREFTFDVEGDSLACGLNGALYLVEMKEDGGIGGSNKAGAKYGTGYCDAQCPHDVKFMGGKANINGWDAKTALGSLGHCCTELDLWEANMADSAFTPHPCETEGPLICKGTKCGDLKTDERYKGVCDKDGCDYNTYRMGNKTFLGPGPKFAVDTTKPVTVVTQFLTSDGTDDGDLVEMRRVYVQGGRIIPNSESTIETVEGDSVTDAFCAAQKEEFDDPDDFTKKGGMKAMGKVMDRGMVLVLSLWDDAATDMLWLDAVAPKDSRKPGAKRGPCAESSGQPKDLRSKHGDASVSYYNFKYGEIGSTVKGLPEAKLSKHATGSAGGKSSAAAASTSRAPAITTTQRATTHRSSPAPTPPPPAHFASASSGSKKAKEEEEEEGGGRASSGGGARDAEDGGSPFCCLSGTSSSNSCSSCVKTGRVGSESWCGRSRFNCQECSTRAVWCDGSAADADSEEEEEAASPAGNDDKEEPSEEEDDDSSHEVGVSFDSGSALDRESDEDDEEEDGDAAGAAADPDADDDEEEDDADDDEEEDDDDEDGGASSGPAAAADRSQDDEVEEGFENEEDPLFPRKNDATIGPIATGRAGSPSAASIAALLSAGLLSLLAAAALARRAQPSASELYAQLSSAQAGLGAAEAAAAHADVA